MTRVNNYIGFIRWFDWYMPLSVREITKSSSTFSATNFSSYIIELLELHDTIQIKLNYAWIHCDM